MVTFAYLPRMQLTYEQNISLTLMRAPHRHGSPQSLYRATCIHRSSPFENKKLHLCFHTAKRLTESIHSLLISFGLSRFQPLSQQKSPDYTCLFIQLEITKHKLIIRYVFLHLTEILIFDSALSFFDYLTYQCFMDVIDNTLKLAK